MRTTPFPRAIHPSNRRALLAVAAAFALGLTGAACSGEDGTAQSADDPKTQTTTGMERTEGAGTPPARLATAEFRVNGMTCGGCALATEMAVKKLDGVRSADASYDEATGEGRCTVEYDPDRVTTERISTAIEEAGFTPSLVSESAGS